MHMVECPGCHRHFKVPSPVHEAAMRCSRCGNSFVGSSVEVADAAGPPPAAPSPAAAAPPVPGPRLAPVRSPSSSPTSVLMVVISFFGIVAVIALVAVAVVKMTQDRGSGGGSEARPARPASRRGRRAGAGLDRTVPDSRRKPPVAEATSRAAPGAAPGPGGDPKLVAGQPHILRSGPGRSTYHACGSLSCRYDKPLRSVTVRAEVDGVSGEPVTYEYVAPNSVIRYSVPLPGGKVAEARVKIVAVGVPAGAGTIAWPIDPADVGKAQWLPDGKVVWRGRTRNPLSTPAKKVIIYCDFFFAEGLQVGSAVGKVTGSGIVGAGRYAYFRVVSEDASLANCEIRVARAVGQEY